MPIKPSILCAERRQIGRFGDRAVAGPFVLLGQAEVVGLVAEGDGVGAERDREQSVEIAVDLGQERRRVGGAERNAGAADDLAALFFDLFGIGGAGRLAPGIVSVDDVPFLAQLADQIGRERDRLGRGVIVGAEAVAVAFGGRQRRVEAHPDHVDELVVLPHRHAGEADIRQKTADMRVDLVLGDHFLDRAPPDIGLRLVVGHDQLDRAAANAAHLVDAVDRHLHADERGLAAGCGVAGQRLQGADPIGLGRAEGGPPRRWRQQRRSAPGSTPAEHPAAARWGLHKVLLVAHRGSSSLIQGKFRAGYRPVAAPVAAPAAD